MPAGNLRLAVSEVLGKATERICTRREEKADAGCRLE